MFKWDAADAEAARPGIAQVEAELGPVEILVNNAGITRDAAFHRMSLEQWQQVMATNVDSLFTMTRPVWEGMRGRKFGRVINISSVNGQKGQFGQTNYAAAKAAAIGFTKALAQEGAALGITVNCVCPGLYRHRAGRAACGRRRPRVLRPARRMCGCSSPSRRTCDPPLLGSARRAMWA